MPKPASDFVNTLVRHLRHIEKTRSKTERLFQKGDLVRRDLEVIYAGLYLEAIASFEDFIEELFIRLLAGIVTHPSRFVVPKITFKSTVTCRKRVYDGRPYVNWLPYDRTQRRAQEFFQQGLPFTVLDKLDEEKMDRMLCIRNAIAHKSQYAHRKFNREVIDGLLLSSYEKKPVGYLRSYHAISPPQTRYELILFDMVQIARKLCI